MTAQLIELEEISICPECSWLGGLLNLDAVSALTAKLRDRPRPGEMCIATISSDPANALDAPKLSRPTGLFICCHTALCSFPVRARFSHPLPGPLE